MQARVIQGIYLDPSVSRQVGRAPRLHLSALQALDAWQAEASQGDIAVALLRDDSVVAR
jgi:hypothetical protein